MLSYTSSLARKKPSCKRNEPKTKPAGPHSPGRRGPTCERDVGSLVRARPETAVHGEGMIYRGCFRSLSFSTSSSARDLTKIWRPRKVSNSIEAWLAWYALCLMMIGWPEVFWDQTGIREGIGVLFWHGLNLQFPVEMLFDRETSQKLKV